MKFTEFAKNHKYALTFKIRCYGLWKQILTLMLFFCKFPSNSLKYYGFFQKKSVSSSWYIKNQNIRTKSFKKFNIGYGQFHTTLWQMSIYQDKQTMRIFVKKLQMHLKIIRNFLTIKKSSNITTFTKEYAKNSWYHKKSLNVNA